MIQPQANNTRSLFLAVLFVFAAPAYADTDVAVGGIRLEQEANVAGVPGDVQDSLEDSVKPKQQGRKRAFETVVAPIPSRSSLLGWTLSVPVMFLYRPTDADPGDQVWVSGAFGFYAENDSWGGGLFHKMSMGGDAWRLKGAVFHADLNYDYYGIGGGGDGPSVPLSQPTDLIMLEALRRGRPNLYFGLKAVYGETEARLDVPGDILPPGVDPEDLRLDFTLATLNPRMQFDTRDNEFYPRNGFLIDADVAISRESIGADADYEKYEFSANNYFELGQAGVVASRLHMQYVGKNAPFFLYPAFGQGSDLRGYQTGTYRDRFLFAAQAEYRHRFTPRLGAVAFAGVGTVASGFADWGKTLGSVGAGFRFVLAPKNNLSLRIDVARGRDESIYYVSIGEAF